MANERVIRIGTEFDVSNVLSGINKIRQDLGNISVDTNLFKDINKDLDNLSKRALSISAALKNGIPEKGVNSFLNQINEVNKIYTSLPEKIRQVNVNANNIKLSDNVATRLEEIDREIEEISADVKKTLGSDLKAALKNALPQGEGFAGIAKSISEADDKTEKFEDELKKLKDKADNTKKSLTSMFTSYSNAQPGKTDASKIKAKNLNELGALGLSALNSDTLGNVQQELARQAGDTWKTSTAEATKLNNIVAEYINTLEKVTQLEASRAQVQNVITTAQDKAAEGMERIGELTEETTQTITQEISKNNNQVQATAVSMEQVGEAGKEAYNEVGNSVSNANNYIQKQDSILKQLATRATSLIGIGAAFNYITRAVGEAWNGIRELDNEFNQIAVVTDKTTSELWQSFSTYSQMAQSLGVTTKDAVATSALYYQQGLDTAEVMTLTAETIKMAQIAGMDFATATNQMTAALRGFNLEMDQASIVNDIFSTLAANAAVSTEELAYALTKTASIAESAGMSIDTTSAFLTKMIETTREAPENIGTAMKSIVARFEELKSNPLALSVEVEGEEVVANKVEKAIALAGVKLRDETTGQFRDLDDVFLELAKSWEGLDRNTQRYIATIAAGSRQQSRFIALMDGYDRTLELVELAQDSEGQSAAQFLKTLDSLDSKLNQISNSLESLYQKFVNSDFFGGLLDSLNDFLQGLGKLDAGQLAIYGTVGLIIGNTIIDNIKKAIEKNSEGIAKAFQGKFGTDVISEKIANKYSDIKYKRNFKNENGLKDIVKNINKNYNSANDTNIKLTVNDVEIMSKVQKIIDQINDLTEQKNNIEFDGDTTEIDEKIAKLQTKLDQLNSQWEEVENKNPNLDIGALVSTEGLDDDLTTFGQKTDELKAEAEKKGKDLKTTLANLMSSVGPAMISSLTLGITTALNSENPFNGIWVAGIAFATQMLPSLFSMIAEAVFAGGEAVTGTAIASTAGVAAIFLGITLAITAAAAGIKQLIEQNKSEAEKLTEQIDKLTDKQKELEEVSERSQAEASIEKVNYKHLGNLVSTYDKLIDKVGRTTGENEKLEATIEELGTDFPDLIEGYDEAGNIVLKQRDTWQEIVDLQKESAKEALLQANTAQLLLNSNQLNLAKTSRKKDMAATSENLSKKYGLLKDAEFGKKIGYSSSDAISYYSQKVSDGVNSAARSNTIRQMVNDITGSSFGSKILDKYKRIGASEKQFSIDFLEAAFKTYEDPSQRADKLLTILKSYYNITNITEKQFDNIENASKEFYNDLMSLDLTREDEQAKEDVRSEDRRLKEQLKKSIINYIEALGTEEEIGGYSNNIKQIAATYASNQIPAETANLDKFKEQLYGPEGKELNQDFIEELRKLKIKESTILAINDEGTEAERYKALKDLQEAYLTAVQEKVNNSTIDLLAQIKEDLSDEDFAYLNLDFNQVNLEEMRNFIAKNIPEDFQDEFSKKLDDIDNKINTELAPQFQSIARQFGYDFGKALQDANVDTKTAEAITKSFSGLIESKVPAIINAIVNIDDWGNIEQLKKLGEAYLDAGANAEKATESVKILYEQFTNPFNINLDEDYLKSRFSDLATQLQDVAKNFKDLNSAIKEYNENGKLSAQTILDIVAAGNIQYLTFDKVTNSVQLNTKAIEDNWKEQTRAAVEAIDLEIARAVAAETALKLQRDIENKKLNILKEAGNSRGRLSKKQYEELQKLENINAINTINGQLSLEGTQISQDAEFFKELLGDREGYYEELAKQANDWGQTVWANFEAGMKQMSLQERVSNTVDTKTFATAWNSSDLNTKSLEAQKRYLQDGPEKIVYQFDEDTLNAYIEAEEKRIKLLNESIESYENGRITLENYRNVLNTIPETSLSDYFSDTAESTKEANEELKEYLSTLERFYNLTREIDEADRKRSKAKTAFEKNPTPENAKAYQQTIVTNAQLGREQYASGKQQQQVDRNYYSKEIIKELTKLGYSPEQIQKFLTKWNLASGQEGYVDQKAIKEFLNSSYIQSLNSEDEIKTIQELNETIQNAENDIDSDIKMMHEGEDRVENAKEEQEDFIEELKEISKKIDPLIAIKAGIEASNKLLDKANEQSEDYYNSGGREGLSASEYGHALGSKIDYNDSIIKQLQDRRETLKLDNSEIYNKYFQDLGNGIITFKTDNINDLIGDPKLLEKAEALKKDLEELYETEEKINKQNKELSKSFKNLLKENRQKYSDMINRVAQALAELDQKQIDEVKKKYAMIQEEDDKYLEKLQKSINKQRQLRDQAKSYDDLEEQEKRLALLERDTSGANAAEIAALKEQIKDARQSLVDMEQDNIVNNIADDNQRRKEAMDEETTFLQNVMDERTYDMQYYIDQAYDIVDAAIAGDEGAYQRMIDVLKKTDEKFFRNTKEAQQQWFEDLEVDWTHAKDHVETVKNGLSETLGQTDSQVHETLKTFSEEDVTYIGNVSQAIDELKGKTDFIDVKSFDDAIEKANSTTLAIQEIINKLDEIPKDVYTEVHIKWTEEGKPSDISNIGTSTSATTITSNPTTTKAGYVAYKTNFKGEDIITGIFSDEEKAKKSTYGTGGNYKFIENTDNYQTGATLTKEQKEQLENYSKTYGTLDWNNTREVKVKDVYDDINDSKYYGITKDGRELFGPIDSQYGYNPNSTKYGAELAPDTLYKGEDIKEKLLTLYGEYLDDKLIRYTKFAKGGLVDYTGPAWVDGTPTSPEAFLSADDTRNIKALTEILQDILVPTTPTTAEKQEVKAGDTNIEIHIDVESISSDYDVDDMFEKISSRVEEAYPGKVTFKSTSY